MAEGELEKTLVALLGEEHDAAGYVASLLVEEAEQVAGADDPTSTVRELVGEFLVGYEITAEEEVPGVCQKLADAVVHARRSQVPRQAAAKQLAAPVRLAAEESTGMEWGANPWGLTGGGKRSDKEADSGKAQKEVASKLEAKEAAANAERERRRLKAEQSDAAAAQAATEEALRVHLRARQKHGGGWRRDVKVDICLRSPAGQVLLEDTSLSLVRGKRYGLVGRNGLGKTTLLRELAGYRIEGFPATLRLHHVEQEVVGGDTTVLQCVLNADLERTWLLRERQELEGKDGPQAERLATVEERLAEITADDAIARATMILNGLQFTQEMQEMLTRQLSGGWRMRVAIACALFVAPDLLLLDEPTNHLDFPAVLWLQQWLLKREQTVLLVSHDRGFLNEVATDIVFLNTKILTTYRGNYDSFVHQMADKRLAQQRAYDSQQKEIAHIQEFIDRFDMTKCTSEQNKKTAKHHGVLSQVQSRQKMLEKMERVEEPSVTYGDSSRLVIRFPDPDALRKNEMIRCQDVSFGYHENQPPLFKGFSCSVDFGSRVGILGANGSGKSTLLKVIQGELDACAGECWINRSMRWSRFAQHHVDDLALHLTAAECLQKTYPEVNELEARSQLARFGLSGDLATVPSRCLSGGQKSRVALAMAAMKKPHLILLDEPTNHLDMDTIDSLIDALKEYRGAVLLVSHDQYFLQQVATSYWSLSGGFVRNFQSLEEAKKATYSQLGKV